jgi:hypothetical protein
MLLPRRSDACSDAFDAALRRQWGGAFDDDKDIDERSNEPPPHEPVPLWQGDPGDGAEGVRSCLAAIGYFVGSRVAAGQVTTSILPNSIESRPGVLPPDPSGVSRYAPRAWFQQRALDILLAGQFRNEDGKNAYRACLPPKMTEDDFWLAVVTRATGTPDFAKAKVGLQWQQQNNPGSMRECLNAWGSVASVPAPFAQIHAMYWLMLGQRHEDGREAVATYRNCFAADKAALMKLVQNPS